MTNIKIGGREIPLNFTTYEMIAIQKEIGCNAAELRDQVFGLHLADEGNPNSWQLEVGRDPEKMEKLGKLIRILGNSGLEENGKEPDLTDKWVLRNMKPGLILAYALVAMAEINEGQKSETAEEEQKERGETSVIVLEEERKKAPEK